VLGRAPQAINLDIELRKEPDEMSIEELRAFRAKWIAAQTLTPALIEATATDIFRGIWAMPDDIRSPPLLIEIAIVPKSRAERKSSVLRSPSLSPKTRR
jgi:hypothetical protein